MRAVAPHDARGDRGRRGVDRQDDVRHGRLHCQIAVRTSVSGAAFEPDVEVAAPKVARPGPRPTPRRRRRRRDRCRGPASRVRPSRSAPAWSSSRYMSTWIIAGAPARRARMHAGQHERRRHHRPVDIHRLGDSLGQHRLSRTQRAGQHHHVTGAQLSAQLGARARWCPRRWAAPRCPIEPLSHGAGPVRATGASSRPA